MIPKIYPVTCHTKHIGPKSTFVAIKGYNQDGTKYIQEAINLGATKFFFEKRFSTKHIVQNLKKQNIEFAFIKNARKTLAQLCNIALKKPSQKLKIIGITGTKGKTTTAYLIHHILKSLGYKTALLSTIKNSILDKQEKSELTTPQSDYLQMFLAECVKKNVEYVVMEVSSHALSLHRTDYINFDAIGFTNLATEHLDFYKNMQNYFTAKCKIFDQIKKNTFAVINTQKYWGKKANTIASNKIKTILFNKKNLVDIKTNSLFGEFNLYNITMAYLITKNLGIDRNKIIKSIKNFPGIPGRLQKHITKNGTTAYVDFAHNSSSTKEVLQTLSKLTNNLIVVLGCGGNRDKNKRYKIGKIAAKYANKIIITDDNPRNEKSENIAQDIIRDVKKADLIKFGFEFNRKKAIKKAATIADKNSIIAILGKGHENYIIIANKKTHFSDYQEIQKY